MNISVETFSKFLSAVKKVGEREVHKTLEILENRDQLIIDEVVNICSKFLEINKKFLFIKKNRQKHDCIIAIVYILQKNNIKPGSIFNYFNDKNMKVNEIYMKALNLRDEIPSEAELKFKLSILNEKCKFIFEKYLNN